MSSKDFDLPKYARQRVNDEYDGWEDFEHKTAERYGGQREIGSGNISGRFDVNVGEHDLMIDNKYTKRSASVSAVQWQSLERKARELDRIPMIQVNLTDISTDLVIMSRADFDSYRESAKRYEENLPNNDG